jgi:glycosidase
MIRCRFRAKPLLVGLLLFLLTGPTVFSQSILHDISLTETDSVLLFQNQRVRLRINRQTGAWTSFRAETANFKGELFTPDTTAALDISLGNAWQLNRANPRYLRHSFAVSADHQSVTLAVTLGLGWQPGGGFAYELTSCYTLRPRESRLARSARLLRLRPGPPEHFDGFRFALPGAVIDSARYCTVAAPGPFWGRTLVPMHTPYDSLRNRTIRYHSAPDAGFGLLILNNPLRATALASFMSTGGEVNYHTTTIGNGRTVTLRHDDHRAYYLTAGQTVVSDTHHLQVAVSVAGALAGYRQMVVATMPLDRKTPAWVRDQVILEVYPKYFKNGGLAELTARLPFYKAIGFTMIYLMPHWKGGYSPVDLYAVDPKIGTATELKTLSQTAHKLGLRVIFDMVIHGFGQQSAVPKEQPDLFVTGETGKLVNHPTWGSVTTDWASPAYQTYMADLVRHDQREYDIDGYRVDAASYKGAGWNPNVLYPAYRDGSAAPELMAAMLSALREKKPESVLLSEVFGPVFYGVCNFGHDNQTEAVPLLQRRMQAGTYTAEAYKNHLRAVFGMLPPGVNRVFFARNHDTDWFDTFDGYDGRFMAFEAVHALFGIPEVFAGDPDYKHNPDDEPRIWQQYKRLFALRKTLPEFTGGTIDLDRIQSSNPQVFSGLRTLAGKTSVVLVNFSDKPQPVTVTQSPDGLPTLTDVYAGTPVKLTPVAGKSAYTLMLQPFQVLAGRLKVGR